MKSNQINFYFMREDISELESYLLKNSFIIVSDTLQNNQLVRMESLNYSFSSKKFLFHENDESRIVTSTTRSGITIINDTLSPVVEYWNSIRWENTNTMPRGRLYYTTQYYNTQNIVTFKSNEFLKLASDLFKWVKKNFKNSKLPGYEAFLISHRFRGGAG